MKKDKVTRRSFIKTTSLAAGAGVSFAGLLGCSNNTRAVANMARIGANDTVRVAVVGIRGMGQNHIKAYQALPNVEVAALCDIDENLFAERVQTHFIDKNKRKPKLYTDIRKLLEDKDIDAVAIVTPNHWHALAAIWSIQAGKHVTVEKPCCHNVFEGQKLVEASKKYNVIVQDGAEQRSNPCAQSMAKFLHDGGLGESQDRTPEEARGSRESSPEGTGQRPREEAGRERPDSADPRDAWRSSGDRWPPT